MGEEGGMLVLVGFGTFGSVSLLIVSVAFATVSVSFATVSVSLAGSGL